MDWTLALMLKNHGVEVDSMVCVNARLHELGRTMGISRPTDKTMDWGREACAEGAPYRTERAPTHTSRLMCGAFRLCVCGNKTERSSNLAGQRHFEAHTSSKRKRVGHLRRDSLACAWSW